MPHSPWVNWLEIYDSSAFVNKVKKAAGYSRVGDSDDATLLQIFTNKDAPNTYDATKAAMNIRILGKSILDHTRKTSNFRVSLV